MRQTAEAAGRLAAEKRARQEIQVWEKSAGHPVSEADMAANALILEHLRAARPGYGWLSEETADDPSDRAAQRVWVVDPIDGTKAFLRGGADWCVGIALVEHGQVVAGVVHVPDVGETYEAWAGGGAFRNGQPLAVSDCGAICGCKMIASRMLVDHPGWADPWPDMALAAPRPNATLLRMAHVAAGQQDATMALWRKSDWDLAAGTILIEEAGGIVTDHRGKPFEFNQTVPAQQSLVAAGKALHPLLLERTRAVRLPDPQDLR